jgi:two-component sensor histidine kinase
MYSRFRVLHRIEASPEGPSRAREIVSGELSSMVPEDLLEDVKLMVSELVTNGVRHGRDGPDSSIVLDLQVDSAVRCAVTDGGKGFRARAVYDRSAGWGLRLISSLADRWGVEHTRLGTLVWFETPPIGGLA